MKRLIPLLAALLTLSSCGIYSFSGTSIQPDVNTITINFFEYRALKVNPSLSNDLTEAIRNQFRRMTRLEQVELDGDMELSGQITGYEYQVLACREALSNGWLESPYMPHQETLDIMKVMDSLRRKWGVVYPMD